MTSRLVVIGWLILALCASSRADDGHRVSIDVIVAALNGLEQRLDPIDVTYRIAATGPAGKNSAKVSWKQQDNKARVSEQKEAVADVKSGDGKVTAVSLKTAHEYLYVNGTLTQVHTGTQNNEPMKGSSREAKSLGASGVITVKALCNLMAREVPEISLAQFIAEHNQQRSLKWSVEPESGLIKLVVPSRDAKSMGAHIWFDPAKSYLPVRAINYYYEGDFDPTMAYTERQITATQVVRDSLGGFDVPREVSLRLFTKGAEGRQPRATTSITIERFVVGKPIEDSVFRLNIPAGHPVVDRTTDKLYTADSTGRPDPRYPIKSLAAIEIPPDASQPLPTRPWYFAWWWAGLLVPVVVAAAYLIYVRRRRLV